MPPAERQRRGWPPPLLAFVSANAVSAVPLDEPLAGFPHDRQQLRHPTPTHSRRHVPPQYSPGTDGIWRRIESYTLVGATICDTCTTSQTTAIRETDEAFVNSIPSGWVRDQVSNSTRTSITVGLSVTLALFIVLTIVRCHFSLRAATRKRKDLEKARVAKLARVESSMETIPPKPSSTPKSRKWMAKATARWRDNARYLGRQRRGRRHSRRNSTDSLVEVEVEPKEVSDVTILVAPPTPSPPSSRPSSPTLSTSPSDATPPPEQSASVAAAPSEPPAYLSSTVSTGQRKPTPNMDLRDILTSETPSAEVFPPYTPRPAPDESSSSLGYFDPSPTSSHSAHLATDDKNVLARLAERASAPEMRVSGTTTTAGDTDSSAPTSTSVSMPGVPAEDELEYEFEGFEWARDEEMDSDVVAAVDPIALPPRLPSPPPALNAVASSSGAALEKMQLERAYAARDVQAEAGPSTPPAIPQPSAPPPLSGDYTGLPSAPTFDQFDFYLAEYLQAGPSTPRESRQWARTPPMEEDEGDDGLEYLDEAEREQEEEEGLDREEELRRRSIGKQRLELAETDSAPQQPHTDTELATERPHRHRPPDTGWDGSGGG